MKMGMIRFEIDFDESNINTKINEMLAQAERIGMSTLEEYANQTYPELKAQYDEILAGAQ